MGKNAGKNAEKNSANKVPRPKNCFILFRLDMQNKVSEMCPGANHRDISRIIAKWWREASDSEHEYYQELAKQEKIEHAKMYPNYKYNPVRKTVATRPYRKRAPHEFTSKDLQKNKILSKIYNEERSNVASELSKNPILFNIEHVSSKTPYYNEHLSPNDSQLAYSDSLSDSAPTCSPSSHTYGEYVNSPHTVPKEEALEYLKYSCVELKHNYSPDEVIQRQIGSFPSLKQNVYSECATRSSYTSSQSPGHNVPSLSNYYNSSQVTHFGYHSGYYTADPKHLLVPYNYRNYAYAHLVSQTDLSQIPADYMSYNYYNQYQYKQ